MAASLGRLAQAALETSTFDEAAGRAALLRRAAESEVAPPSRRKWWAALPALAVVAALVLWLRAPSALRYEVVGAAESGPYVSAPATRPLSLRFSDETKVEVAAGSQLRIEETTPRGARVLLERGTAGVHVVHRDSTRWTFVAGPFEVLVTGTRFDLKWEPAQQKLELLLREGSVEIKTPLSAAPVALRGGQEFRADLTRRSMTTAETGAQSATPQPEQEKAAEPADDTNEANANDVPADPNATGAHAALAPSGRTWPKLVAAGEFEALLAQANERGVANCARSCSAGDLRALADAARYSGRSDVAEQSLRGLRSRFAREPEGRAAAFLLGRLREGQGGASEARTFYETYLSESPGGSYAAEALAGKMRMTQKLEGRAAAQPIARDYLKRYPNGVHAGTARGILGSP